MINNHGFKLKRAEIHKIESILIIGLKERTSEEIAGMFGGGGLLIVELSVECGYRVKKQALIINQMSVPKIKRLKTPLKHQDSFKSPQSTVLTHAQDIEESTISLIKSVTCSQSLQVALINEINKVYKEIANLKDENRHQQTIVSSLVHQKEHLQSELTEQMKHYKEMYELEVINHMQLRKFYEQRELEWRIIVDQHRQLLEQYDRQHCTTFSKLQDNQALPTESVNKHQDDPSSVKSVEHSSVYRSEKYLESRFQKKDRSRKASSLQRKVDDSPKLKLQSGERKEEDFYKQISRLYNQESKFARRGSVEYKSIQKDHKGSQKNAEIDDFVDKVVRKTYYLYKEKCVSVAQIQMMQDMKKLKNANTSTRERLIKTVKKLNFALDTEYELKAFCQYIERAVVERFRTLRGDFAFQFLIDKLKECEKMALSSNSELERLDKEKSHVRDEQICFDPSKVKNMSQGPSELQILSKHSEDIEKVGQKNLELLLNSTIKSEPRLGTFVEDSLAPSGCSSTSRRSDGGREDAFFRFRRRESANLDFSCK